MDSPGAVPYTFRLARESDRPAAFALRHEVYSRDRGYAPSDRLDELGYLLVGLDKQGSVVACSRLVADDCRPFDIEQFLNLEEVLPDCPKPAEVGRLCVRKDQRGISRGQHLQLGMLKMCCLLGVAIGVSHFVMYTFPDLVNFYRTARFVDTGRSFVHPGYGQSMRVMKFDLAALMANAGPGGSRFAHYLFTPDPRNYEL